MHDGRLALVVLAVQVDLGRVAEVLHALAVVLHRRQNQRRRDAGPRGFRAAVAGDEAPQVAVPPKGRREAARVPAVGRLDADVGPRKQQIHEL